MSAKSRNRFFSTCLLAGIMAVACTGGEVPTVGQDEFRFEMVRTKNGQLFRFDKQKGILERIIDNGDGGLMVEPEAGNMAILGPKEEKRPSESKADKMERRAQAPETRPNPNSKEEAKPKPKSKIGLVIEDDEGKAIAEQITHAMRAGEAGAFAAYIPNIAISQMLNSGERIKGTILLRNDGRRRLKVLEVTMYVPVVEGPKPAEYRFVFRDSASDAPPEPGLSVIYSKVDVPAPPGVMKRSPDIKVTYIKFADEPADAAAH